MYRLLISGSISEFLVFPLPFLVRIPSPQGAAPTISSPVKVVFACQNRPLPIGRDKGISKVFAGELPAVLFFCPDSSGKGN